MQVAVVGRVTLATDFMQPLKQRQQFLEILQPREILVPDVPLRLFGLGACQDGMLRLLAGNRNSVPIYLKCANGVPNTIGTQLFDSAL